MRFPYAVYWDLCDQPEIRKLPGVFRVPGERADLELGQLAGITWSTDVPINYMLMLVVLKGITWHIAIIFK